MAQASWSFVSDSGSGFLYHMVTLSQLTSKLPDPVGGVMAKTEGAKSRNMKRMKTVWDFIQSLNILEKGRFKPFL